MLLILGISTLIRVLTFSEYSNQAHMQEWQYPYEVRYAEVMDSIQIAYVDEGEGPETLIFLHGLGSNLQAWNRNIDVLRQSYRCIALDLPGYGKSGRGDYAFDMTFFARSVTGLITALDLRHVVLVGHSMGGQIAMHVALQDAAPIEKLILIAPAGFEQFTDQEKAWFRAVYTPELIHATPPEQIVRNFEINFSQMPDDARFMIEDRMLLRESDDYQFYCAMLPRCVAGMLDEPVFHDLGRISVPVMVIYGAEDKLIPNTYLHPTLTVQGVAESGCQQFPDCTPVQVAGGGHFVQWEQSAMVNQHLAAFAGQ